MSTLSDDRCRVRLGPVLRRHLGLTTVRLADGVGVSRQALARLVGSGEFDRWHRGVYASRDWPDGWERRALAVSLALGPAGALTGFTAARIHRLEHLGRGALQEPFEYALLPGRRPRTLPARVRQPERLRVDDLTRVGPHRVTTVAWSLASLATRLRPAAFEAVVDGALASRRVVLAELEAVADRLLGCPGQPALFDVLSRWTVAKSGTRSDWERRALRLFAASDLPAPDTNVEVVDARGRTRFLDVAWRPWWVYLEVDVHPVHASIVGRTEDGIRQNDLVHRWRPLRVTSLQIERHPQLVVDQARRVLRAAGALV